MAAMLDQSLDAMIKETRKATPKARKANAKKTGNKTPIGGKKEDRWTEEPIDRRDADGHGRRRRREEGREEEEADALERGDGDGDRQRAKRGERKRENRRGRKDKVNGRKPRLQGERS